MKSDLAMEICQDRDSDLGDRVVEAIELAEECAQFDGAHHKMWVIDQMLRILLEDHYDDFIRDYCCPDGEDDAYEWDEGIAP